MLIPAFARAVAGVGSPLNPERDLLWKKDFSVNSWFTIGHFDHGGQKLNFLYHAMVMALPQGSILHAVASITNETTGWYSSSEFVGPVSTATLADDRFSVETSNGGMNGDFSEMKVWANVPGGSVDIRMSASSPVIYNGGTGCFDFLGMSIHQYSVPRHDAVGRMMIDGHTVELKGVTWFDRQWQHQDFQSDASLKWTWMDINLDNGDTMSLWSAFDLTLGRELAWTTILHTDGTQTVTAIEPISKNEFDHWTSEQTGNTYPTRWLIKIPQFDAVLEVIPSPRKQELISQVKSLHRYEGASAISGTYKGKSVHGFGYVELVGKWNSN